MEELGFDNEKYLEMQSEHIRSRINQFGGKLYLEFGGKLFDDHHASRVLPGFHPDSKVRMLMQLKEQVEIVVAVSAVDLERSKMRGDLGISYGPDTLRLIDAFRGFGFQVDSVVLTRFSGQGAAEIFQSQLENLGLRVYRHYPIEGYPNNVPLIVSEQGYGKNEYVETTRSLVVVTAPGPGSGKMAVCLSQLYHEFHRGVQAGYAKFETFPIWNLPLKHPVNLAYEAATADLNDVNMIDPFHLEAYGETTVNYNRDVEIFPVLKTVFERISGHSPYRSPTDMGVNMAGYCIVNDQVVRQASQEEILRRYYAERCRYRRGRSDGGAVYKIELLMKQLGLTEQDRAVVGPALAVAERTGAPAAAMELPDGKVLTGKTSALLGSSSALLLNALKYLAGIPDDVHLISPAVIEPVQDMKVNVLGNKNPLLHIDELLVALSISAVTNPNAKKAVLQLQKLRGCEVHTTVILSEADEDSFRRLGVRLTSEPKYQTTKLYHG
ncbi:MAG: DUF1846 domain-containing protein [Ruminiclostridium sp.]|nr:DUF1846 domain-containing protein [Ruminiclostridium sp.]MCI9465806.1 DUF1846 domain-containing protein [Ruminiclostridium sp.]